MLFLSFWLRFTLYIIGIICIMGILGLVPPAHYPRPIRHSRPIMPSAYLAYYA